MRTLDSNFWTRLVELLDEGTLAWAIAIELTNAQAFYLTNASKVIRFRDLSWFPYPMKIEGFPGSGDGDLPGTNLSLTNIGRIPMPYLEDVNRPWDQARVIFLLVYVPEPSIDIGFRLDYAVQAAAATHETVTLNLGQPNFFRRNFPGRRYLRDTGFPGIPRNRQ